MRPSRRNPSGRGSAGAPHGYGSLIWNHQTALAESRTVHPAEPPARPRCKATEDPCWKCGIGLGAAREKVRVAHALECLPKISDEFRQGRISFSKVRGMTRVATPANEDELLNIAWHGTASHVERLVSQYRKVKRLEALEAENQRYELRELNWHVDDDGSYVLKARLTPEQGERIVKAIESAMDEEFEERKDVSAERSSPSIDYSVSEPVAQRRADALIRVAEGFFGSETGTNGGERSTIHVHTDLDTLRQDGDGAESRLDSGAHISAETSRRLSCDCGVVHWQESESEDYLNIGRRSRSIPPAIRRALKRRDHGCRFPGCTAHKYVDAHHTGVLWRVRRRPDGSSAGCAAVA